MVKQKKIKAMLESKVIEILEKSVRLQTMQDTIEIPNDYVFIFAGGIPPFQMLEEMGILFGGKKNNVNQLN